MPDFGAHLLGLSNVRIQLFNGACGAAVEEVKDDDPEQTAGAPSAEAAGQTRAWADGDVMCIETFVDSQKHVRC